MVLTLFQLHHHTKKCEISHCTIPPLYCNVFPYGPNTLNNTLFSYVVSLRKLLPSVTFYIYNNTAGKMLPIYVTKQPVFNNCPTKYGLFSLLYFCRQLYMFRVLTPIIRGSYNCNYSFWYWSTSSTTIRTGSATYSTIHMNQSQLNNESG